MSFVRFVVRKNLHHQRADLIHISNPDLPDASNPTMVGGFAPPAEFQSCIQGAATMWTIPASTHPTDRCQQWRHSLATEGD